MGLSVGALDVPDRVARLVILNTFLPTGHGTTNLAFRGLEADGARAGPPPAPSGR